MAVYLDSSALVKLVIQEAESKALRRYLKERKARVSSALARVEVVRAVRSHSPAADQRARAVLARTRLLSLDDALLDEAAGLDPGILRSLDAIHIASACQLGDELESLVTYDRRMAEAAQLLGLRVEAPA